MLFKKIKYIVLFFIAWPASHVLAQYDTIKNDYVSVPKTVKADTLKNLAKLYISFSGGASFPIGSYYFNSQITYTNSSVTQFAGIGANANLLVGMPLPNQKWEVQLMLSYITNSVNDEDYLDATASPNASQQGYKFYSVEEQNTNFHFYNAVAAFARTFRSNIASIDVKVLAGYSYGVFPSKTDHVISDYGNGGTSSGNGIVLATYTAPHYSALLYGLGAGAKIFISSKAYIMANADMLLSTAVLSTVAVDFNKPIVLAYPGQPVTSTTLGNTSAVKQLNVSLGVGFAFLANKKK
jgi:hypothetical protein